MADFLQAYNKTIANEGGYTYDPNDDGGETYVGIARVYNKYWKGWQIIDDYKKKYGKPKGKINNPELEKLVYDFYYTEKWIPSKAQFINNQDVANFVFDTYFHHGRGALVVNNGVNRAMNSKVISASNKITADTIKYINAYPAKIYPYIIAERKSYIKNLKDYKQFGEGWLNRILGFPKSLIKSTSDNEDEKKK